jgi:hypothetical protein
MRSVYNISTNLHFAENYTSLIFSLAATSHTRIAFRISTVIGVPSGWMESWRRHELSDGAQTNKEGSELVLYTVDPMQTMG